MAERGIERGVFMSIITDVAALSVWVRRRLQGADE